MQTSLFIVDVERALHGPAECSAFRKEPPYFNRKGKIVLSENELEVDDIDVLKDGECFEIGFNEYFADLYEWIEGPVETGGALVLIFSVVFGSKTCVYLEFTFEAGEANGVLPFADAGKAVLVQAVCVDYRIGLVRRNELFHHILLLLQGRSLHA